MQSKVWPIILFAVPSISRAPTLASVPDRFTSAVQSMTVVPSGPSDRCISAVASTALPGAWPWALIRARSGRSCSANSMLTLKRALMKPMPTLAVALKWVGVDDLDLLDARPARADLVGIDDERPDLLARRLDRHGTFEVHESSWGRPVSPASGTASLPKVRRRLLDEPGAAPDRTERVDDPVVVGQVAGMGLLHGHPADRIDEDDIVNDRFE